MEIEDAEKMEAEFIEEQIKEAEQEAKEMLEKMQNFLPQEEYEEYIAQLKHSAKAEEDESKEYDCDTYVFDFDEEKTEVLVHEKHINKTILDLLPVTLKPCYFVYANDIENPEQDSKIFHYFAFLDELQEVFSERGFDDQRPKCVKNLFKLMKRPKMEYENSVFPELEIVFDKPTHEVFASILVGDKILVEDVLFKELDKTCESLNQQKIPTTIKPSLPKLNFEL